jgi:hypothetical protein
METSPMIHDLITHQFKKKFEGKDKDSIENFNLLKKPDICDTIISVSKVQNKWYLKNKDPIPEDVMDNDADSVDLEQNKNDVIELQNMIIKAKDEELIEKQKEAIKKARKIADDLENLRKQHAEIEKRKEEERLRKEGQIARIDSYINTFVVEYSRKPMKEEIEEHFKSDIDEDIVIAFLESYTSEDV